MLLLLATQLDTFILEARWVTPHNAYSLYDFLTLQHMFMCLVILGLCKGVGPTGSQSAGVLSQVPSACAGLSC